MTNEQHLITPPFELMNQWYKKACKDPYNGGKFIMAQTLKDFASSAAQWGADQELEACCEWVAVWISAPEASQLRAARRPKSPSLKEQAYDALDTYIYGEPDPKDKERTYNTIRRALEAL